MPRRISPQEYQRLVREQQRQINEHNRKVAQHNQKVARGINEHNRNINEYNRRVSEYNDRSLQEQHKVVRRNEQILNRSENSVREYRNATKKTQKFVQHEKANLSTLIEKFNNVKTRIQNTEAGRASVAVEDAYSRLSNANVVIKETTTHDIIESERLNNIGLTIELYDSEETDSENLEQEDDLIPVLSSYDADLCTRWQGAIFALKPENPDAGRHFCSSARDIFTQILHNSAPDKEVSQKFPECERDNTGRPTRRSRVKYILNFAGEDDNAVQKFFYNDAESIIQLFKDLNAGTHGPAGKFSARQLLLIKGRVSGTIQAFLSLISRSERCA